MDKIKSIALAVLVLAVAGCTPEVIVKRRPVPGQKNRVAVLPFRDAVGHPGSGATATEIFSAQFLTVMAYDVVDRDALGKLIDEQKLGASGFIDSAKAIEAGKLLGADAVLLGAVTEYQERKFLMLPPAKVSLTVRLIDTRTGAVEWSAQHSVGGAKRWLTWIIWPVGAVATAISPSAEDLLRAASRRICKTVHKRLAS